MIKCYLVFAYSVSQHYLQSSKFLYILFSWKFLLIYKQILSLTSQIFLFPLKSDSPRGQRVCACIKTWEVRGPLPPTHQGTLRFPRGGLIRVLAAVSPPSTATPATKKVCPLRSQWCKTVWHLMPTYACWRKTCSLEGSWGWQGGGLSACQHTHTHIHPPRPSQINTSGQCAGPRSTMSSGAYFTFLPSASSGRRSCFLLRIRDYCRPGLDRINHQNLKYDKGS